MPFRLRGLFFISRTICPMMKTGDVPRMMNSHVFRSSGALLNSGEKNCTSTIWPTKMTAATVQNTLLPPMLFNAHLPVANDLAFNIFQNCRKTNTLKKMPISCGLMLGLMPHMKTGPPLASRTK